MNLKEISVVITTKNDGSNLERCLASVDGFGEMVLVDAFSTDDTVAIARSHRAIVLSRPEQGTTA